MTLIVEDGTGVADADALTSLAFADAYFLARGVSSWADATEAQKEIAIIKATDYMEIVYRHRWKGVLDNDATTLSFPRCYFYSGDNVLIDFADGIPTSIQRACAEYALRALTADLLPDPSSQDSDIITSEKVKVGPIEKETSFLSGSNTSKVNSYPVADKYLAQWINGAQGQGRVYR